MGASISPALIRHLTNATVEVVSWSAAFGELMLRVRKEIGSEAGLLRSGGVGAVHLSPRFTSASRVTIH